MSSLTWTLRERKPKNGDRDGPYTYHEDVAESAVQWFPKFLKLPEGPLARHPFVLPEWQADHIRALEGWRRSNGRRRYTRSLLGVGRGNAKSSFVAGRATKALIGDGVPVPKPILAGTDRENAGIIFGYAASMVRSDKRLLKKLRVLDSTKRILRKPFDGGLLRVISSDAQHAHGIHPTFLAIDDLQAQLNRDFIGVLFTSQGTVENPLTMMCMTAEKDEESPGREEWDHAIQVLHDPALDEELLVDLHYLEPDDDWQNSEMWIKANPNLGISVFEDFLRQQVKRAIERPSVRNEILMLHFNIWPRGTVVSWIPPEQWDAAKGAVDISKLRMRECYVGIMATSAVDIAAVSYFFPQTTTAPAVIVTDFFVPADNISQLEAKNKVSYQPWIEDGWLTVSRGRVTDEKMIRASIERRIKTNRFQVQEISCNPRGGAVIMRELEDNGHDTIEVLPSFGAMSPAMRDLEGMVKAGTLHHGGNSLLDFGMHNFQGKTNPDGDLKPDRDNSTGDFTGPVSMLMAMSRYIAAKSQTAEMTAY